jgi:integrase
LAGILDVAKKDGKIAANPARGVDLPRKVRRKHDYLTHSQVESLACATDKHGTLIRFLAYTGLRWGEATALRVQDVDFLRRRVSVTQNAVRVGGQVVVGTPKTHNARSVPFPAFLVDELSALCIDKGRDSLLFGNGLSHLKQSTSGTGWFSSALRRLRDADPDFPVLTVHDLRHTAASLAISSGANVKAVQKMLGHASAAMTLDVYADLFDDDLDAVASSLTAARAAAL